MDSSRLLLRCPEESVGFVQEYEERAVAFGLDRAMRLSLRGRLEAARLTCPLFDTRGWVRSLEEALVLMWEVHCRGEAPRDLSVK